MASCVRIQSRRACGSAPSTSVQVQVHGAPAAQVQVHPAALPIDGGEARVEAAPPAYASMPISPRRVRVPSRNIRSTDCRIRRVLNTPTAVHRKEVLHDAPLDACMQARHVGQLSCTYTRGQALVRTCASLQLPPPREGPRRDITCATRKGTFEPGDAGVHQSVLTGQDDGDVKHASACDRRWAQQIYAAKIVLRAYRRHQIFQNQRNS